MRLALLAVGVPYGSLRPAKKALKIACLEVDEVLAALSTARHAKFTEALGAIVQELGAQQSPA
jgi:hypothetical protein